MQKVFVITKAELLQPEVYVSVRSTAKAAEKAIRDQYPNAKKEGPSGNLTSFVCKKDNHQSLMFIHEETLD